MKLNKKGFTLAELLIVVAIIAVLIAIAIPVFGAQLEKSRDAQSVANIRSAYAQAVVASIQMANVGDAVYDSSNQTVSVNNVKITSSDTTFGDAEEDLPCKVDGTWSLNDGGKYKLTFTFESSGNDKVTIEAATT